MEETRQQGVDEPFTYKAKPIEDMMTSIAGRPREAGHCVMEDRIPEQEHSLEFRTPLDRKEYSISGLCQTCQDAVFNEEDDEPEVEEQEMVRLLTDVLDTLEHQVRMIDAADLILKHVTQHHLKEVTEMCPHLTLALASYWAMHVQRDGVDLDIGIDNHGEEE